MQKLELHANPFSVNLCLGEGHVSCTLVFVKKHNESDLLSCIEPFLLLAQETGNSTGPANGGGGARAAASVLPNPARDCNILIRASAP